jgi:DNA-binding NarL/FixJ family response regulator
MKTTTPISVLLAEDHMVVREGLRKLLDADPTIKVVGEASNGRQAVDMTRALHPHVIVMDIAMPQLNGLEAMRQIRLAVPDTKVVILSAHADDAYVEEAIKLGAMGYLIKQTSFRFLSEAIRHVHQGKPFFSPCVAKAIRHRQERTLDHRGQSRTIHLRLSAREAEVLQQIAEGSANKQIATALGISIKTVEKHRDHLMQKLDIHDTAGLTRYAIRTGVIESSVHVTIG